MPLALLAPYDKTGLDELAFALAELGYDIYSTSGTQKYLAGLGLPVHSVSSLTGFPEILDGRVKTLHPKVHGGILARRDVPEHMAELERSQIAPIDVVAVNLYPFRETIAKPGVTLEEALENIDIGGPAMLRAAAKNHPSVIVLVDPEDYEDVIDELRGEGFSAEARRRLAAKAFQHVASYDTAIAAFLRSAAARPTSASGRADRGPGEIFPEELTVGLRRAAALRYGENPHQKAALYAFDEPPAHPSIPQGERPQGESSIPQGERGVVGAEQLHGPQMSYLNYFDADAAWRAASEFEEPSVVIVKHATPCGVACHSDIAVAYQRAYECDEISPFGGIIAANRTVTWDMTEAMKGKRYDIMVAPGYEERALERLRKRRDLRILRIEEDGGRREEGRRKEEGEDGEGGRRKEEEEDAEGGRRKKEEELEYRSIVGGMLVQEPDARRASELEIRVMTKRAPTAHELEDLRFAWTALKYVKSNAIVVAKDHATVGIGHGQPNRLWATQLALEHAGERARGAVLASDAFFPFARGDAVEDACKAGVTAIIQPGGGVRDEEAVAVCDEYGVAMVFTGTRAFRH